MSRELIKKEYLNHQFFCFFDSIINNNIIEIDITSCVYNANINKSILKKAIYNQCFEIIMYLSLKTLVLDINIFSKTYTDKEKAYLEYLDFLESREGLEKFFTKYEGLKKQLIKEINYFIKSSETFLKRLQNDFKLLKNKFKIAGDIIEIEFSQGDSHCHKQTVIKVVFEDKTIFYKPQNFESIKIIEDINFELEKDSIPVFNIPHTIYRSEGYIWQEEVLYCESSEVEARYVYRQYGTLACLAYIFNISDLHMNNLIVSKDKLYLIDTETFLQRNINKSLFSNHLTAKVYEDIKHTVLSTGLFPIQFKKYKNADVSGICGRGNQIVDKGKYEIINKNRGDMRLIKSSYCMKEGMNIVKIGDKVVNPRDFAEEIIYGFEVCYNYFMIKKLFILSKLSRYDKCYTRLIYRNTADYSKFLLASTNPKYMKSEENRNSLFSLLKKSRDFISEEIIKYEIYDLMNGDIPYFTVDLNGIIYNSTHSEIGRIDESENIGLSDRIKKLSYENLDFQIDLMITSLAKPKKRWEENGVNNNCFENAIYTKNNYEIFLEKAISIFDDSIKNAISNDEEITWVGVDITESEQWVISPINNCLYNGLTGNAIAFLYIYDITKDYKYYSILNKIINTITKVEDIWDSDDYSVFLGKGGILYLYYLLWKKLNVVRYKKLFLEEIKKLREIDLETQNIDYISGVSGLLVVLCNIYEVEKIDSIYEIIVSISNYIITKKIEKDNKWVWYSDIDSKEILNGLSHGLSGIAYSLIKSWKVTGNLDYYNVALSAISFENTRKKDGNWIDFRNYERRKEINFREPIYWCHGAAGIGMVRSKINEIINDDDIKDDLNMAINTVLKMGSINSDCLCHGKFGNLELLMLEDNNNEFELNEEISSKLLRIIEDSKGKWESGIPQDKRAFTLMLGEIGIAYQLVRFYSRYKVPSILMLDVPKE